MNNEKFIIINLIKELIDSFDKYLTNFPKSEIELKRYIYDTCYEMLKLTYEANTTFDNIKRVDFQDKIIADIKYLDYLINKCYDKKIINSKKYLRFGNLLEKILRYTISWQNKTRA